MIFKQYYLGCLAHASYLIGDEKSASAVVVDPQRDIATYLADAAELGLAIEYVFLTHFHADFVAGHLELRDVAGARICLGSRAEAEYDFEAMDDGGVIEIGQVRLKVLHTPGHTPEGISILVYDLAKSHVAPHAVLTGDTLFVGDVGRPDLMASVGVSAGELAGMLYDSLHEKLMKLPDETLVYPAHGAGSLCGKALGSETFSTIGEQKQYNYALQAMSRDDFIAMATANLPDAPDYFGYDAALNRSERPRLPETLDRVLNPLPLADVLRLQREGAQLLDVREPAEFAGAHLKGSINIGLGGKYATWAGTVLGRDSDIIIIADLGQEVEAATRLGRIGFDHIAGFLDGGMQSLETEKDGIATTTTTRWTAKALAEKLAADPKPTVIDVRAPGEHEAGRIAGSVNIPLNHLLERIDEVPRETQVVVHCASGYRSSIAASLLQRAGIERVADLVGGMKAWEAAKLPREVPEQTAS